MCDTVVICLKKSIFLNMLLFALLPESKTHTVGDKLFVFDTWYHCRRGAE